MKKISIGLLLFTVAFLLSGCSLFIPKYHAQFELNGAGEIDNPYQATIFIAEETIYSYTLRKDDYEGNLRTREMTLSDTGVLSAIEEGEEHLDVSNSIEGELVVTGLTVGTYFVLITIEDTHTLIEVTVVKRDIDFNQQLKVLAISNSFGVDALEYLYQIADDYGVEDIVLGVMYIPGASLETHVTSFEGNNSNYIYYKNNNGTWVANEYSKLITGLQDEAWDVITFQQASHYSGLPDTYNEDLDDLIAFVDEFKTNPNAIYAWHMTWAYQQDSNHSGFANYENDQLTMYQAITTTVQSQIPVRSALEYVIPAGTTIQNLRTSYYGDTLTRDGYHLSLSRGRYAAGLTWFAQVTGFSIDDITYRPDGVSEEDLLNTKEAVNNAIDTPYTVTQSTFTE